MAKSENKTKPTGSSVREFINSVAHEGRRNDALTLLPFFERITGWEPRLWGPSLVGFGRYHYKYESGREGDMLVTGFSPRKANMVFYIMPGYQDLSPMLKRLGKHKIGKSCLYTGRVSSLDMTALEEIVRFGVDYMKANYEVLPE